MGSIDFKKIEECGARAATIERFIDQLTQEQHFDIGVQGVGQRLYCGPAMLAGEGADLKAAILTYLKNRVSIELTNIMRETAKID